MSRTNYHRDHTQALEALRRVNAMDNKTLGMKQHINVQFAIENTLVLQKRERRIKVILTVY